jgi:hypothetical protein
MNNRQHTIVCIFDTWSPKITALQVHEWIYHHLQLPEDEVRMIQINGPGRCVFIKFNNEAQAQNILQSTSGQMVYQHENGESYTVYIEQAGMGTKRICIANLLLPEVPNIIRDSLSTYGEVLEILEESWSKAYRYSVFNGIRIAMTRLKKRIPSNMSIAGNKVLITYENQPPTCYGCNTVGHHNQDCPKRRLPNKQQNARMHTTWADVLTQKPAQPPITPTMSNHAPGNINPHGNTSETSPPKPPRDEPNAKVKTANDTTPQEMTHTTDNSKNDTDPTSQMACSTRNNNTYNAIQGPSINTVTNEDIPAIHDSPEKITGNKTWDPDTGKRSTSAFG